MAKNCNSTCSNLQNLGQNVLSYFYNITTSSWTDAVRARQEAILKPWRDLASKDKMYINQLGQF